MTTTTERPRAPDPESTDTMLNANTKPPENRDKVSRAREERMQDQINKDHARQVEEIRAQMASRTTPRTPLVAGRKR